MILADYLRVLRRGWWVILGLLLIGGVGGLALARATPPSYFATATVYVSLTGNDTPGDLQQGNVFSTQRAPTYAALARTSAVLDRAAAATGDVSSELRGAISASARGSASLIDIVATGDDPVVVASRANAVAAALALEAARLDTPGSELDGVASPVTLTLVEQATPPAQPTTPRPKNNVLIGAVVGLIIGIGVVVVRDAFDSRIRSVSDVPRVPGLATLTSIPVKRSRGVRSLGSSGSDDRLESLRNLRANLQFGAHSGVIIAVAGTTSASDAREVAKELGSAFGEIGASVVVVDVDLRPTPAQRRRKDAGEPTPAPLGVIEVLTGQATLDDALTAAPTRGGVRVLPPGAATRDSSQLLSTPATRDLLTDLVRRFDHVLLACAPVVERSEAAVTAALSDTTLMVVESGDTKKAEFLLAVELLAGVGVSTVNVAVDHVRGRGVSTTGVSATPTPV